jgi:hypothetical protein
LLVIIALASFGCVSVRATTAPGTNLAQYKTWAFADPTDTSGVELRASPTGQTIGDQVARTLELRGMRQVPPAIADCLVDFDYITENKLSRARQGYGWGYNAGVYGGMSREGGELREYTEGTLVIDLLDAKTRETLWRGTAVSEIDRPNNPKPQKVAKAVDKVMQRL